MIQGATRVSRRPCARIGRTGQAHIIWICHCDAAFAKPELYEYLEARSIGYAIRPPANQVLEQAIAHLLVRPTECPSPGFIVSYHDFAYQAQSWGCPRRVVAKVEGHQGELFPRVGFIVTNLCYPPKQNYGCPTPDRTTSRKIGLI